MSITHLQASNQVHNLRPEQAKATPTEKPVEKKTAEKQTTSTDKLDLGTAAKGAIAGGLTILVPATLMSAGFASMFQDNVLRGALSTFKDPGVLSVAAGAAVIGGASAYMASGKETVGDSIATGMGTGALLGSLTVGIATLAATRNPVEALKMGAWTGTIVGGFVGGIGGATAAIANKLSD